MAVASAAADCLFRIAGYAACSFAAKALPLYSWVRRARLPLRDRYNEHGIGICLVGNFDDHPPSRAQTRRLQKLVRYLCHQYAIPADHVYTHGDITGKTRCPAERFDLDQVRAAGEGNAER